MLLSNKRVTSYAKLLIVLYQMEYYHDDYIPSKKLINYSSLTKREIIRTLKQLSDDKIISVFYEGKKRYFRFNNLYENEPDNNEISDLNYDWLVEGDDKNE